MPLEPHINGHFVLLNLHHAALVQQRHNRAIRHRLIDRVGMDDAAKAQHIAFLACQERRAGEADVARVGKHLPHARGEHAKVPALRFIHQYKNLGRRILKLATGQRLVEFVDERGDDVRFVLGHQFQQMPPRFRAIRRQAAGGEGIAQLLVEIHPIRHQYDARRRNVCVQRQRFRQHHHRQRFSRALRVPHNAARSLARTNGVGCAKGTAHYSCLHPRHNALHREKLLVTRNFSFPAVKHREQLRHAQQPLRATQCVDCAILLRHREPHAVFRCGLAHAGRGRCLPRRRARLQARLLRQQFI